MLAAKSLPKKSSRGLKHTSKRKPSRFSPRRSLPDDSHGSRFSPPSFIELEQSANTGPVHAINFSEIDIFPREIIQTKLMVGPAGDGYEREADQVARMVAGQISSAPESVQRLNRFEVQAKVLEEPDWEETSQGEVQRTITRIGSSHSAASRDLAPHVETSIHQARAGGHPLADVVREPMERAFGADFSGVRVHTDSRADGLNRSIQARAFTTGQDIFLRRGEYRPGSSEGRRILAHELTHVVQQGGQGFAGISSNQRSAQIQRVGGEKFGYQKDEDISENDADFITIRTIIEEYRKQIKEKKEDAKKLFDPKDISSQTKYTMELKKSEMDKSELIKRISDKGFLIEDDGTVKNKNGKPLARILIGAEAYKELGSSKIYKRFSLEGVKKTDYIKVFDRMLRRYAYRGITPPEYEQIKKSGDVLPIFSTEEQREKAQAGMHFEGQKGRYRRRYASGNKPATDLGYLSTFSNVTKVEPEMYAFAQARKGAGKFFSFTSTPKPITSNAGEVFTKFASIKVDLSKVDVTDFVFHYAGGGAEKLESGLEKENITDLEVHERELQRAKESLLRNREIILKKYPSTAVVELKCTNPPNPTKIYYSGYKDGYNNMPRPDYIIYEYYYERGYLEGQDDSEIDFHLGYEDGLDGNDFCRNPHRQAYRRGYALGLAAYRRSKRGYHGSGHHGSKSHKGSRWRYSPY